MRCFRKLQNGPAPVASVLAAALMLALPNGGQAATWCVPSSIPGFVCDDTRQSIGDAVRDAAPGDTIRVAAGTYSEHIPVWKPLTLLGAMAGIDARNRTGAGESIITNGLNLASNLGSTSAGSVIDGFTFSGSWFGIQSWVEARLPLDGLIIRNNRIFNYAQGGISLFGPGSDITITRNVIDGPTTNEGGVLLSLNHEGPYDGLQLTDNWIVNGRQSTGFAITAANAHIGPSDKRTPLIQGNLIRGNWQGAAIGNGFAGGEISDNEIVGNLDNGFAGSFAGTILARNTFLGNGRHGFHGTPMSTEVRHNNFHENQFNGINFVGTASNNTITDNEFAGNHGQGLAGSLESSVVERNTFRDNSGFGIAGGGAAGSNVTIRDNEFRGNGQSGLSGYFSVSTIEGNLLADNGAFGIQLFTPVHDTTITGNLMMRNGLGKPCVDPRLDDCGGGIEFGARRLDTQQPDTNLVRDNTLSGNRFGAYYAYIMSTGDFATLEIPMAGNYWGTTSGPFHPVRNPSGTGNAAYDRQATDASATGKILFYPWLMLAPGDTPRKLSQAAAVDLNALLPTGNKQTDDRIGKAVNAILDSMKPSYWAGDFALTGKGGKVFDEDRKAVNELQHVTKSAGAAFAGVKESIEDLVVADEVLARTAIWAAVDGNGNPAEIAKARDEFTKAVSYQTAGNWDNAVDHFKKAWEHATRAL